MATRVLESKVVNSGWEKRLGCFAGSACPSLRLRSTRTLVLGQSIALAVCRLFRGNGGLGRIGGGASRAAHGNGSVSELWRGSVEWRTLTLVDTTT
jgi:hypothetical protein